MSTGRISVEHLARAVVKVKSLSSADKIALLDEISRQQPNLLASCLAQPKLGVAPEKLDFLLDILLTCFQAMKESAHEWPVISQDAQSRNMQRLVGAVRFSEDMTDPALASQAREQYLAEHPETPLLAYVINECKTWLQDLARRGAGSESDKFVMIAAINMVNCIAHADIQHTGA